jgi:hypothetical protein
VAEKKPWQIVAQQFSPDDYTQYCEKWSKQNLTCTAKDREPVKDVKYPSDYIPNNGAWKTAAIPAGYSCDTPSYFPELTSVGSASTADVADYAEAAARILKNRRGMKMKYFIFLFFGIFVISADSNAAKDECGALFYKNGVTAAFPVIKKRDAWEWHKKESPEYSWIAETGFYSNKKFTGNGFGFMILIGSLNLDNTPKQRGGFQDLVDFAGRSAFLTKDSKYYTDEQKRIKVKYSSHIFGKVIDDSLLMVGTLDTEAVRLAKMKSPTHMKLQAILPEEDESYICYPEIEIIE